ncbi:receptor-like serine/threonine-protein kinase ale2 [Phtheirospermum japonicum]|uniref:Receptor-like serine/threonine-protein kinase ale2 n=1 Tax=Phtheirospermum japonicum TaxID=374723 RepID=A0A830CFV9_9LAMI|nr:receptor-like serine/threonine-protein kinase ale2 [Phtheirospermum japonicum]
MGVLMLQVLSCAFACSLVIHGSAGTQGHLSNSNVLISIAPTPVTQPNGPTHPADSFTWPSPSIAPIQGFVQAPAPATSPSSSSPSNEQSQPPTSPRAKSNVPAPSEKPESSPPSLPPDVSPHPALPRNPPPVEPIVNEPPSSPPEQNSSPILAPPPSIRNTSAAIPVATPSYNKTAHQYAPPLSYSPTQAPNASNPPRYSDSAPPPRQFSKSTEFRSPRNHHRAEVYNITPAPEIHVVPPPSSGASASVSPIHSKSHPLHTKNAPVPAPAHTSPSWQAKFPSVSPKASPPGPSPKTPEIPLIRPMQALPPPPRRKDCGPMTCTDPFTYSPPKSPCACVLPIQVSLRLAVALYTFFPLVSELATEIASGVFIKQSQVRIMGANAAEDNPDKTIALIYLLPLEDKFDDTTAYFTFQRFWQKQVGIKTSLFGDYDVLYVRYPGLPPSPPLPPSTIGIIPSKPYPGGNNPRSMQPLGVDVSGKHQKQGLSGSIVATIILSCFAAVFLLCAVAWVFVFRYRHRVFQPDPTPPTTIPSLAKSSGIPVTMAGSGNSSPSFSLGSSITAYTGSAKTFSSSDIEKATDFFNETRIVGEGGFGRVYSGVLEDGTKAAVKILKRYDQQGSREFLAEVEMLSRLHHRNLVKLIGICVEHRTRCLVYELIPNGSVESHLHGCDKERSPLDWSARLKIALGSARALAYLHEDSSPRVIHRDFKASNILLEEDFTPKVSDFGLARTGLDEENRHVSTRVMGTFGYVAPEYAMTGHLLVKSDVYSYGVVLLELLTGRKPVDMSQPPGEENLVSWARPLLTNRQDLESIIDQSLMPESSIDSIAKVAAIASMCVQPEVSHRPFMGEVVQALKLVCNECDEIKEHSRSCSLEVLSIVTDVRDSAKPAHLLSPSTFSDYDDYRLDVERDLSMSELLSPEGKFGAQDSESFRRHSSSGPLRTGKAKPMWKSMRRLSRGSVSEHGVLFRFWPGSH